MVIASDGVEPDLDGGQGLCKIERHTLYINSEHTAVEAYPRVRAHEELHMIGDMGAAVAMKAWLKAMGLSLDEEQYVEFEELLNETYGAGWFAYLSDNGYLRYPQL